MDEIEQGERWTQKSDARIQLILKIIEKMMEQGYSARDAAMMAADYVSDKHPELGRTMKEALGECSLNESRLPTEGYGGWILPNGTAEVVDPMEHASHIRNNHNHVLPKGDISAIDNVYMNAFKHGYVRYESMSYPKYLCIQGIKKDIVKQFKIWFPETRNAQNVEIAVIVGKSIEDQKYHSYKMPEDRARIRDEFGPLKLRTIGPGTITEKKISLSPFDNEYDAKIKKAANELISAVKKEADRKKGKITTPAATEIATKIQKKYGIGALSIMGATMQDGRLDRYVKLAESRTRINEKFVTVNGIKCERDVQSNWVIYSTVDPYLKGNVTSAEKPFLAIAEFTAKNGKLPKKFAAGKSQMDAINAVKALINDAGDRDIDPDHYKRFQACLNVEFTREYVKSNKKPMSRPDYYSFTNIDGSPVLLKSSEKLLNDFDHEELLKLGFTPGVNRIEIKMQNSSGTNGDAVIGFGITKDTVKKNDLQLFMRYALENIGVDADGCEMFKLYPETRTLSSRDRHMMRYPGIQINASGKLTEAMKEYEKEGILDDLLKADIEPPAKIIDTQYGPAKYLGPTDDGEKHVIELMDSGLVTNVWPEEIQDALDEMGSESNEVEQPTQEPTLDAVSSEEPAAEEQPVAFGREMKG